MNCEFCQDHLIDHYHGELDEALAAQVAAHLSQCGACALEYCRLDADIKGIGAMLLQAPPPALKDSLRQRVAEAFPKPEEARAPGWLERLRKMLLFPVPAYQAALLAVALLIAWLLLGQRAPSPEAFKSQTILENFDATTLRTFDRNVL